MMVKVFQSKLVLYQPEIFEYMVDLANSIIGNNETLLIALKGTFKEYLFCTDQNVYIIKMGYMTGHTFGNGIFTMSYKNISNVEIDMRMLGGYFEISGGGMQNTQKSYWSSDKQKDPAKQPNTISLGNRSYLEAFNTAKNFILNKVNESHLPQQTVQANSISPADEILKYKKLLDEGIITVEEFALKKKELLGL